MSNCMLRGGDGKISDPKEVFFIKLLRQKKISALKI